MKRNPIETVLKYIEGTDKISYLDLNDHERNNAIRCILDMKLASFMPNKDDKKNLYIPLKKPELTYLGRKVLSLMANDKSAKLPLLDLYSSDIRMMY